MRYVPSPTVLSMVVYGASGLAFVGSEPAARARTVDGAVRPSHAARRARLRWAITSRRSDWMPSSRVAASTSAGRCSSASPRWRQASVSPLSITALPRLWRVGGMAAMWLLAGTAAGGLMLVAAARFQSQQRFVISLALVMSQNPGPAARRRGDDCRRIAHGRLVVRHSDGRPRLGGGSRVGARPARTPRVERQNSPACLGTRRFSLAGVSAAGMLFIQLERLVIPHVLDGRRPRAVRRARRHCGLGVSRAADGRRV